MTASISAKEVIITGTGSEVVTGTDSIKVETHVTSTDFYTIVLQ